MNRRGQVFPCKVESCQSISQNFNKTLNHTWDKHGLRPGFFYKCEISDCTRRYTNIQSFRRHVKEKHVWFYDKHLRRYERGSLRHDILMPVDNVLEAEHENFNQDEVMGNEEQIEGDDNGKGEKEILSYKNFNHDLVVANFLLGLRENFNTTTEAMSFVSEKNHEKICLEQKIRISMIRESFKRNHEGFQIGYETEMIMDCVSPLASAFDKFKGKKSVYEFIRR